MRGVDTDYPHLAGFWQNGNVCWPQARGAMLHLLHPANRTYSLDGDKMRVIESNEDFVILDLVTVNHGDRQRSRPFRGAEQGTVRGVSEQSNPAESFLGTEQILTKLEEIKEGQDRIEGILEAIVAEVGIALPESVTGGKEDG